MSLFFMFKRVVGMVLRPLPMVFLLLIAALVLYRPLRRAKAAWGCLLLAAGLLLLSSFPPAARYGARTLESDYMPLTGVREDGAALAAVVVLGNGVAFPGDESMPALSRLNDTARARLIEGVRLARRFPDAGLFVTGYGMGLENCADAMAEAAMELGIEEARIVRFAEGRDTEHEAELVRERIGDKQIALVTSAVHMPRAMLFFGERGVNAIAAPCDFIAPVSDGTMGVLNKYRWRPQGKTVSDNEELWHEWMGLLYYHWFRPGQSGE